MDNSVNSYLRILEDNLLKIGQFSLIFIKNNVLIYKTKKIIKYFKNNKVVFINWLSYSFKLNFIQYFYYKLKKLIYQVYLNLDLVISSNSIIQTVFKNILKEA